jgi:hypothetical protein
LSCGRCQQLNLGEKSALDGGLTMKVWDFTGKNMVISLEYKDYEKFRS